MLNLKHRPFITYKELESSDDCQDAYAINEEHSRYAVADGATRSFFPKWWAELLVRHFCEASDIVSVQEDWTAWLAPIQKEWHQRVEERVKARNLFYLTNSFNAKKPAAATLVGFEANTTQQTWKAVLIGDSCLFHVSETEFRSEPLQKSGDFTDRPQSIASIPARYYHQPKFIGGEMQPGDLFILATDALAKWILTHREYSDLDAAINKLTQIEDNDQFKSFVAVERKNKNIRLVNDDVALIVIEVESAALESDEQEASSDSSDSKTDEQDVSDELPETEGKR